MSQPPNPSLRRPALLLGWLLGLAGCATNPGIEVPAANVEARLVLVNLTARAWDIALAPAGGGAARVERLAPQATREVAIPGGDYAVEQTLLDAAGRAERVRRLVVRLRAGGRYRWPLATLPADAEAQAGVAAEAR